MLIDISDRKIWRASVTEVDIEMSIEEGTPICDESARTIASWWQSSASIGSHFAQLASTGKVDYDDIMFDIDSTEASCKCFPDAMDDMSAMRKWAESKFKEGE